MNIQLIIYIEYWKPSYKTGADLGGGHQAPPPIFTCTNFSKPYICPYANSCSNNIRPVARGGQGGQLTPPPLRTKGPLFGTSRVKLLRPITING